LGSVIDLTLRRRRYAKCIGFNHKKGCKDTFRTNEQLCASSTLQRG